MMRHRTSFSLQLCPRPWHRLRALIGEQAIEVVLLGDIITVLCLEVLFIVLGPINGALFLCGLSFRMTGGNGMYAVHPDEVPLSEAVRRHPKPFPRRDEQGVHLLQVQCARHAGSSPAGSSQPRPQLLNLSFLCSERQWLAVYSRSCSARSMRGERAGVLTYRDHGL